MFAVFPTFGPSAADKLISDFPVAPATTPPLSPPPIEVIDAFKVFLGGEIAVLTYLPFCDPAIMARLNDSPLLAELAMASCLYLQIIDMD